MSGWTEADARELQGIRLALRDIADVLIDAATSDIPDMPPIEEDARPLCCQLDAGCACVPERAA